MPSRPSRLQLGFVLHTVHPGKTSTHWAHDTLTNVDHDELKQLETKIREFIKASSASTATRGGNGVFRRTGMTRRKYDLERCFKVAAHTVIPTFWQCREEVRDKGEPDTLTEVDLHAFRTTSDLLEWCRIVDPEDRETATAATIFMALLRNPTQAIDSYMMDTEFLTDMANNSYPTTEGNPSNQTHATVVTKG